MRHICSRKNYNLYINDVFNLAIRKGYKIPFHIYTYMVPILRFLHHFYTDIFSFENLYIITNIHIYKTYSTITIITNIL